MAKLSAHGAELARYFSPRYRALLAVHEDGVTLFKTPFHGWKVLSRKKPEVPLATWRASRLDVLAKLPAWARECKSIPTFATLERWENDGICETVSGDRIEPDGVGHDGAPSWLRALGML